MRKLLEIDSLLLSLLLMAYCCDGHGAIEWSLRQWPDIENLLKRFFLPKTTICIQIWILLQRLLCKCTKSGRFVRYQIETLMYRQSDDGNSIHISDYWAWKFSLINQDLVIKKPVLFTKQGLPKSIHRLQFTWILFMNKATAVAHLLVEWNQI